MKLISARHWSQIQVSLDATAHADHGSLINCDN
jgi:hypothetical protein